MRSPTRGPTGRGSLGLVLGWARLRSGGLQAPMAVHALVNAFSLTVMRALGPGS